MEKLDIRKLKSVLSMGGNYRTMVIAFLVMLLFYPIEGKFKYTFKKGSTWKYETLEAPIDFPILKSAKELQLEKSELSSELVPYYSHQREVLPNVINKLKSLNRGDSLSTLFYDKLVNQLTQIYTTGVISKPNKENKPIFVNLYGTTHERFDSDFYTLSDALASISDVISESPSQLSDSLLNRLNLSEILLPNLLYDKSATDELHRSAVDYISPTKGVVYTGQYIVGKGELITENIDELLTSLKAEYQKSVGFEGNKWPLLLGHVILIIAILLLVYISIYFSDYQILRKQNEFNFIIFILCLNFALAYLVGKLGSDYAYIVPFSVMAIYMYAFVYNRVVMPIFLISLIPLLLISENGIELFLLAATGGAIAFITFSMYDKGWQQFLNALYIFVAMALVHTGFMLCSGGDIQYENYKIYFYLFLNAIFIVLAYPLVFLFEKMFRMASMSTYKELSDTDNKVLRELAQKAPGTFQHSLQVSNLAERAVLAIGGNSRLVRVGAMYHDIGKMLNPQAFIENQPKGINYHATLSPKESASIIIKHVSDGVELAKRNKLPQAVIDFILSHHANSTTEYFYNVYCNNGGDPADKDQFTYHGELPVSKEQVVVMMADAVEAASRSLKEYSAESISALVDGVVAKRISGSQLERADISYKEINTVKKVFKQMLSDIYHARIAYPTLKRW